MLLFFITSVYALNLQEIARYVNSQPGVTWKAAVNPRFAKMTEQQFSGMNKAKFNMEDMRDYVFVRSSRNIPDEFNAAEYWPNCKTIGHIYDQGHCGSCWAMAAFEVMQDRFCIYSNGTKNPLISGQHMTSCTPGCYGCNGGWSSSAFSFAKGNGVTTEECIPYQMGECTHPGCSSWPTPKCNRTCYPDTSISIDKEKYYVASYGSIKNNEATIQTEIMTNGPVTAAFTVYADLATYKSGVYHHVTGSSQGGHAVKITGWGVLNGVKYWRIANSWNTDWGMDGYLLIRRGTNECGIERDIVTCVPKL